MLRKIHESLPEKKRQEHKKLLGQLANDFFVRREDSIWAERSAQPHSNWVNEYSPGHEYRHEMYHGRDSWVNHQYFVNEKGELISGKKPPADKKIEVQAVVKAAATPEEFFSIPLSYMGPDDHIFLVDKKKLREIGWVGAAPEIAVGVESDVRSPEERLVKPAGQSSIDKGGSFQAEYPQIPKGALVRLKLDMVEFKKPLTAEELEAARKRRIAFHKDSNDRDIAMLGETLREAQQDPIYGSNPRLRGEPARLKEAIDDTVKLMKRKEKQLNGDYAKNAELKAELEKDALKFRIHQQMYSKLIDLAKKRYQG